MWIQEKFKKPQVQGEQEQIPNEEALYEIANRENQQMLDGAEIPPTGFATKSHTEIHLAFMSSDDFKLKFNDQIANIFSRHIAAEAKAQEFRGTAAAQQGVGQIPELGGQTGSPAQGIEGGAAQAAQPAQALGPTAESEGVV